MSSSQFVEVVWSSGLLIVWSLVFVPGALLGLLAYIAGRRGRPTAGWSGLIAGHYILGLTMAGGWTWQAAQAGVLAW